LEFSLPPYPLKAGYLLYLRHILPRIGALLSSSQEAYVYLNKTIESFPSGDAFAALLRQANYQKIVLQPMALGAVTLYTGIKA
jgi:demethylmenaquinone methyltransferase/2-methoxy-6-polyprenyl-1,4-benzoquinol methylase